MRAFNYIPDRNRLTNELVRWLSPNDQGYFISLNSLVTLNDASDSRFEHEMFKLQPKITKLCGFLKEYCYGNGFRRSRDESLIKCVLAYEIGQDNGRLHVHVVGAHDGTTNRTADDVQKFMSRKWAKLMKIDDHEGFAHVEAIDVLRDRVWYVTKQSRFLSRWHGESTLDLA
ncbi:hypothetical protein [Georgfuchsia toluolica]|nr:hypothetical protein [Georgfuchsia toluolica]